MKIGLIGAPQQTLARLAGEGAERSEAGEGGCAGRSYCRPGQRAHPHPARSTRHPLPPSGRGSFGRANLISSRSRICSAISAAKSPLPHRGSERQSAMLRPRSGPRAKRAEGIRRGPRSGRVRGVPLLRPKGACAPHPHPARCARHLLPQCRRRDDRLDSVIRQKILGTASNCDSVDVAAVMNAAVFETSGYRNRTSGKSGQRPSRRSR